MDAKVKVSVIVPVYGVERFVERCVDSLMRQTMGDGVEFIFVDDCSPDRSMSIVADVIGRYPGRRNQCRVLSHSENLGLPAARNTGLGEARGEYVYHCDSDDFLEPDLLESLYGKAVETGADMVWSDWYLSFGESERLMVQPDASTGREALRSVLCGRMKYNVWNKLTRRELFIGNGISFPAGRGMGEDMTMIRLMAAAGRTARVGKALYHYVRTNSGAMTQTYSERHLQELRENVELTEGYLRRRVTDGELERELGLFKLSVKLPFLFTGRRRDCAMWRQWYREADRHIMSNRAQALHTRLLQWCASKGMTWVNLLYTRVVFDFYYGMVFK